MCHISALDISTLQSLPSSPCFFVRFDVYRITIVTLAFAICYLTSLAVTTFIHALRSVRSMPEEIEKVEASGVSFL